MLYEQFKEILKKAIKKKKKDCTECKLPAGCFKEVIKFKWYKECICGNKICPIYELYLVRIEAEMLREMEKKKRVS